MFCKDISSARGERFLELLQFKKKDSPIIYCVGSGREWTKMGPISQGYLDTSFKKPFLLIPSTAACPVITNLHSTDLCIL